jgi:hypothetical protein
MAEEQQLPESTLKSIAHMMEQSGERLEPVPVDEWERDPTGGKFKKEVMQRAFVPYIGELAVKVGTPGTVSPSKGVSFRAEDGKYYDLIELLRDLSVYVDRDVLAQTAYIESWSNYTTENINRLNQNIKEHHKWIKSLTIITTISIVISLVTLSLTAF